MVPGGFQRKYKSGVAPAGEEHSLKFSNSALENYLKILPIEDFIRAQQVRYLAHSCRHRNTSLVKTMIFAKPMCKRYIDPWKSISKMLQISIDQARVITQDRTKLNVHVNKVFKTKNDPTIAPADTDVS